MGLFQPVGVVFVRTTPALAAFLLGLGLEFIAEFLQAVGLCLVPAPCLKVAQEVRIIVRRNGVRVAGTRLRRAPGAADQQPEDGAQDRQDDLYDDPGRFGNTRVRRPSVRITSTRPYTKMTRTATAKATRNSSMLLSLSSGRAGAVGGGG